ncbi:uncharacterized protein OCT59_009993 [Rhizophagus irregularis]|uniref:uncharacterized protein n=1 Tax=Rhizophagus irregularis TaxID=588596 RepID=UPI0033344A2E|nr:hypothetical protein OCT59_009993 [Rhizophagus irregularis]
MSCAVNPVYVRQSIAERFARRSPNIYDINRQMIHRASVLIRTSPHFLIVYTYYDNPNSHTDGFNGYLEEIPLITQSSTSTSSLSIAIPSVTSSTLPRMNPISAYSCLKFYLKNRRYPTSIRPYANSPEKFTDRDTNISYNQKRISNIISLQNSIPKWLRIIVINELKSLFLRTRNLDKSNNNQIIEDFLASLLPTFMNDHPDILHNVAKSFRKTWSYWRNTLWDNIKLRYETYQKRKEKDESLDFKPYLKGRHIEEIFNLWLKFSDKPISQENENSLKNLILFWIPLFRNL